MAKCVYECGDAVKKCMHAMEVVYSSTCGLRSGFGSCAALNATHLGFAYPLDVKTFSGLSLV